VVRTVFKIDEAVARRLVGSIPTRSRQNAIRLGTIGFLARRAEVGLTYLNDRKHGTCVRTAVVARRHVEVFRKRPDDVEPAAALAEQI
jgi:hypothetical protein